MKYHESYILPQKNCELTTKVKLRCFFGGVAKKMKKPRGSHKENLSARQMKLFLKHKFYFVTGTIILCPVANV